MSRHPCTIVVIVLLILGLQSQKVAADDERIPLSDVEQQWLAEHPEIRLAPDPDFPPFEWLTENGQYQGIAADYVRMLERKLGLRFKVVKTTSWSDALEKFRSGKADILPAVVESKVRNRDMNFTRTYISIPGVIISSSDYHSLDELAGKKVAVVNEYIWEEVVRMHRTGINLVRVQDTLTGLQLAADGAVDAMISDVASVSSLVDKHRIENLRIVGYLEKKMDLAFAVRKDLPVLYSIIERGLQSLTIQDEIAIRSKWLSMGHKRTWRNSRYFYPILIVLFLLFSGFVAVIIWNRSLRYQVRLRSRELEAMQKQLIHAEKMESIGRLSVGVAHEVKNPLAIIQMGLDYIASETEGNKELKPVIDDVEQAVARADSIIRGLMDFSREMPLKIERANINRVIENSVKLVQHELNQHNIDIEMDLAVGIPDICLDTNRMQQVFINLLMNAIHAIDRDGQIIIHSVYRILGKDEIMQVGHERKWKSGEKGVIVEICDTGTGIDEAIIDKIFEPFYTTKPVGSGTGMGLSVSQKIIQLHHGQLSISNRPAGGVCVQLLFRIESEEGT